MAIVGKPSGERSIASLLASVENRISGGNGSPDSQYRINMAILEALQAILSTVYVSPKEDEWNQ